MRMMSCDQGIRRANNAPRNVGKYVGDNDDNVHYSKGCNDGVGVMNA